MYGIGSNGQHQEESEEEYDVFAEVEKERVVKTYSKESATSKVQWNSKHEQEQLQSFKDLALVGNPTRDSRTREAIFQKNLHHRLNGPAGLSTFSPSSPSPSSHDSSSRLDSSSAAGHASNFASGNNFMGNKDESPTSHRKEDSETVLFHLSSGSHGENFSDQQIRQNKNDNFPGALSKMSIGAAYGALKNMKPNQN